MCLLLTGLVLVGCGGNRSAANATLEWLPFDSVQATFPAAPKPMFLYVSQAGCDHCQAMDSLVFGRPEVAHYVNESFTAVKVDINMDMPIVVQDSLFSEDEFRRLLSIQGIPAYYFFDEEGRILGVLDSEMGLLTFKRMLVYIREGHFFQTAWSDFLRLPEASEEAIDELF
jgi:thioredoxin-related protein